MEIFQTVTSKKQRVQAESLEPGCVSLRFSVRGAWKVTIVQKIQDEFKAAAEDFHEESPGIGFKGIFS